MKRRPGWYIHHSDGRWIMAHRLMQRDLSLLDMTKNREIAAMYHFNNSVDFIVISDREFISIEVSKPDPKEYVNHWKYFNE